MKNLYKSIINSKIILIISNKCTNKNLTSWNRIESEESNHWTIIWIYRYRLRFRISKLEKIELIFIILSK